ncbi:MAG: NAD(P)-binding domain-containing protein [Bacteroidales bacterium]|nr:NAD(P)-binding domain-containing protein [Bacteroidales bacterium]
MGDFQNNITIIGAGSIGTALGNIIARKRDKEIYLYSIEKDVVDSINNKRLNFKYFPNIKLAKFLKASSDPEILKDADIVFLAIPSIVTVDYILEHRNYLKKNAILLNLAKGFSREQNTITESLSDKISNPVCAFKGPTFARELIQKLPTAFTLGSKNPEHFALFQEIFKDTPVHIDFSTDVKGVELLSILKNIYAIAMGIVDAHFNSPNLRFLFLTRAFNEMKQILVRYGGNPETMFNYCGYGDFTLTALNDLSRNRTLGLLIGKGFFVNDISDKVVLEGKIAVSIFCDEISKTTSPNCHYPIMSELYKIFNGNYDISRFVNKVINN